MKKFRCVLQVFQELLIGQDPMDAEACWHRLYAHNRKPVAKGEYISAIGVTDIALWDLKGKRAGEPLWRMPLPCPMCLLDAARLRAALVRLAVAASSGFHSSSSAQADAALPCA